MSDISTARQALRDYARESSGGLQRFDERGGEHWVDAVRGEHAGQAFVAVQAALTVAEELRAESRQQPVTWNDDKDLAAKAEAADRIEAAIRNAFAT